MAKMLDKLRMHINIIFIIDVFLILMSFHFKWSFTLCFFGAAGRKKKEQHDANQAGVGPNPAYGGAYGAAPPVRFSFLFFWRKNSYIFVLFVIFFG